MRRVLRRSLVGVVVLIAGIAVLPAAAEAAAPKPAVPQNLTVAVNGAQIRVSWTAPATGVTPTNYRVAGPYIATTTPCYRVVATTCVVTTPPDKILQRARQDPRLQSARVEWHGHGPVYRNRFGVVRNADHPDGCDGDGGYGVGPRLVDRIDSGALAGHELPGNRIAGRADVHIGHHELHRCIARRGSVHLHRHRHELRRHVGAIRAFRAPDVRRSARRSHGRFGDAANSPPGSRPAASASPRPRRTVARRSSATRSSSSTARCPPRPRRRCRSPRRRAGSLSRPSTRPTATRSRSTHSTQSVTVRPRRQPSRTRPVRRPSPGSASSAARPTSRGHRRP